MRVGLLSIALIGALAPAAWAQKTDVVRIVNGDVLTGSIKLLDQARLKLDTDNIGTVNVEWDKVAAVTAARMFRVDTSDGSRFLGSLAPGAPGLLTIVTEAGPESVELIAVVSITPIGAGFWSRLDGSLDMGLGYTQSSGVAQLNVSASAIYRRPVMEITASGSSYYTHQQNADDTARNTTQLSVSRSLKGPWFWLTQGGFERNQQLGYALRSTVSTGPGRYLVRSNRAIFAVGAGVSTNSEVPVDGEAVQNVDALVSMRQSFFTYDYPKTSLSLTSDTYTGLSEWGRIRTEFTGGLKRELVHDFTLGITIYDSYDNRPPTVDARKNDVGVNLTVGWMF